MWKGLCTQMHRYRCMASKTISVDDEAYGLLRKAKLPEESFSDVVKRLLSPERPKLMDLAGILTPEEGERVMRAVRQARKEDIAASEARQKRLWG